MITDDRSHLTGLCLTFQATKLLGKTLTSLQRRFSSLQIHIKTKQEKKKHISQGNVLFMCSGAECERFTLCDRAPALKDLWRTRWVIPTILLISKNFGDLLLSWNSFGKTIMQPVHPDACQSNPTRRRWGDQRRGDKRKSLWDQFLSS